VLDAIALGQISVADAIKAGRITVEGDASKLEDLFAMLDTFNRSFPVIEPKTVN
jgi:alkyl sulfatase BDS1-like metallo-beta-lactamase superfamily hydrolase